MSEQQIPRIPDGTPVSADGLWWMVEEYWKIPQKGDFIANTSNHSYGVYERLENDIVHYRCNGDCSGHQGRLEDCRRLVPFIYSDESKN